MVTIEYDRRRPRRRRRRPTLRWSGAALFRGGSLAPGSLHALRDDARDTLDQFLAEHADRGAAIENVEVTLAQRTVGELTGGETITNRHPSASAPDVKHQQA